MMVKNNTDFGEFVGGALVPPDGDYHQVKDGDDVREAIASGTLTAKRGSASSSASSSGDNDDKGGDNS